MSPKPWLEWATTSPAIDSYIFQLLGPVVFGVLVGLDSDSVSSFLKMVGILRGIPRLNPKPSDPKPPIYHLGFVKKMWFFTDSTMVNQHVSPPYFGIFLSFLSNHRKSKKKTQAIGWNTISSIYPLTQVTVTNKRLERGFPTKNGSFHPGGGDDGILRVKGRSQCPNDIQPLCRWWKLMKMLPGLPGVAKPSWVNDLEGCSCPRGFPLEGPVLSGDSAENTKIAQMISCQFKLRSHMCDWIAPFLDNDGGFTIRSFGMKKNGFGGPPKIAAKKWQVTIQGCEYRKMKSQRFTDCGKVVYMSFFWQFYPFRDSEI